MKKVRITLLVLIILLSTIGTTGCWNYREINNMSVVAGVAVDKGTKNQVQMTVELIKISPGKD